jgi:hypothetical protein
MAQTCKVKNDIPMKKISVTSLKNVNLCIRILHRQTQCFGTDVTYLGYDSLYKKCRYLRQKQKLQEYLSHIYEFKDMAAERTGSRLSYTSSSPTVLKLWYRHPLGTTDTFQEYCTINPHSHS